MIRQKHFYILEAISVLLFSILANFIFDLKINFKQQINWILIAQLIVLSISTFIFYFMVDKLKKIYHEAEKDYYGEKEQEEKANNPIDKRYETNYSKIRKQITTMALVSIIFALLFFLIEPIANML